MVNRRLLVALLLFTALSAAGLAPGVATRSADAPGPGRAGDAATTGAAVAGVHAPAVRVKLDDRRHAAGQRLSTKSGLWLVAVLALVAGLFPFRRRWCAVAGRAPSVRFAWWSPLCGRSPPSSPLAVR